MAYEIVVVGTSLGGMRALQTLLSGLSRDFPLPLVVVQHRSVDSGDPLRLNLQRHSSLRVREAQDKQVIERGHVYLAPSAYHLLVEPGSLALSTEAAVSYARPSIDVLFETASDAYRDRVIGVVLTGASSDGARGAAQIKARGGYLLVQEPASAECAVMPAAALAATAPDRVLPLAEIAPFLCQLAGEADVESRSKFKVQGSKLGTDRSQP